MKYFILNKNKLNTFISLLAREEKIVAPVAKGYNNYTFSEVTSAGEISLKYIPTILPPKKYFMPRKEALLEFDTKKGQDSHAIAECEKTTIFGVHTCDLAGIRCLNAVFSDNPKDQNYLLRSNSIKVIGLECNEYCDEHASCALVGAHLPNGGYDLFFTDLGDYFIVCQDTDKGLDIIKKTGVFNEATSGHISSLENLRKKKEGIFKKELSSGSKEIHDVFSRSFDSPVWQDVGNRCLSCGNCTNVCPTCYCFDIADEMNLDLKTGKRYRIWDSCQVEPFALVAGSHNFRKERSARQRHRYYRKFKYSVIKYSLYFCTGCGRCTRACMAKINLKETLKSLIADDGAEVFSSHGAEKKIL